jgi:hypothetical protein
LDYKVGHFYIVQDEETERYEVWCFHNESKKEYLDLGLHKTDYEDMEDAYTVLFDNGLINADDKVLRRIETVEWVESYIV